ncbi:MULTISPECIES: chemotaxis protein CheW [Methylomonas]|uniref:chemotaxis protein CheW n=1 Tax=Methylomonas TaxID=416 RepID=UPI001232113D|nr:chemotaxis protein CheW [Methylomonas rhizoryzae]
MTRSKPPQHIVQQQLALDAYLTTLLEEIPDGDAEIGRQPLNERQIAQQGAETPKRQTAKVITQTIELPPQVTREALDDKPAAHILPSNLVAYQAPAKLHPLSVMPYWAQHEFQALFFKVDNLILATPLTELARTIKIDKKPGQIPGQPSWFMGLLDEQDSRIGVLDMGQLIFGKLRGSQRDLEKNPFKSILITQDKRWGLACDEVLSIGRVRPDKVRWRTSRQKKPWLIGTVIEELTAIIDLQALVPQRRK